VLIALKEAYKGTGKDKDVLDACERLLRVNPKNTGR
jgi:hypothetical protein